MVMDYVREENQNYDAWLFWAVNYKCNLNCAYCGTRSEKEKKAEKTKIAISDLMSALNKTNKTFRITLTGGGEPFLIPNIIEACAEITQKHYISFNTNLTSKRVEEFCEKIDPERVLFIIASLHIKELERLNLLDRFIYNFQLCKAKGFQIYAKEVAYIPLLAEVRKYKTFFEKKGIQIEFNPFIGEYNGKKYPYSYTGEELTIFGLDKIDINKFYQQGKLCNAGYNVGFVNQNGYITPCGMIHKPMGNIYDKINFQNKLIRCPFKFCGCPLNIYDPYLYN
jgi:MoaA/NifB/PqqE/SkfB family radical SAM enzyme